ncbi:MAG: hypothetical protein ABIK84_02645 [candidate division WOR-3 bacterium]
MPLSLAITPSNPFAPTKNIIGEIIKSQPFAFHITRAIINAEIKFSISSKTEYSTPNPFLPGIRPAIGNRKGYSLRHFSGEEIGPKIRSFFQEEIRILTAGKVFSNRKRRSDRKWGRRW